MYAVIETGGKQYRVQVGDQLKVEKLNVENGADVEFDKVLVVGEGSNVAIGTPYVDAARVFAEAVETGKGDKVIIYKYKAKKDYRKKQGHRQPYTLVEIKGISPDGNDAPKKAEAKKEQAAPAEKPAEEAAPAEAEAPAEEPAPKKTPSLKSMRKAELIEFAKENGIDIDEKATNAVMIETIENALK